MTTLWHGHTLFCTVLVMTYKKDQFLMLLLLLVSGVNQTCVITNLLDFKSM